MSNARIQQLSIWANGKEGVIENTPEAMADLFSSTTISSYSRAQAITRRKVI